MADETADVSNKEQLVICIRWVDDDLTAHEDFIGMYPTERTTADVIVRVLKVYNHLSFSFNEYTLPVFVLECISVCRIMISIVCFVLILGRTTSNEFSN